jgi:hypothetical protein
LFSCGIFHTLHLLFFTKGKKAGINYYTLLTGSGGMSNSFSNMSTNKVKQFGTFKIDYSKVRNLEYIDQSGQKPQPFAEFRKVLPPAPMYYNEKPRPIFEADLRYLQNYSPIQFPKGKMLVLVNMDLYASIKPSVDQYIKDIAYEGYFATTYLIKNGSPSELRNFIKGKLPIVGALLIGSLPVAWYEMSNDFNNTSSEFPMDLYYMDLNGTWNDPDNDGKFSEHPTNVEPEIWVWRLWTPTQNGNDAALINDYFKRNHQFRKGQFGYSDRALAYVDDDWTGFDDCALDKMFLAALQM